MAGLLPAYGFENPYSRFIAMTWRGWRAYRDPDIDNRAWWMESTADFMMMGVGWKYGGPLGAIFLPEIVKQTSIAYAEPFMQLSLHPLEAQAIREHQYQQQYWKLLNEQGIIG